MKQLCSNYNQWFENRQEKLTSIGLLVLRVSVGSLMLFSHGWGKMMSFAEKSSVFPDPLGIGSPLSMGAAIGAEVFCSALLIVGLCTRLAVLPLAFTMLIAIVVIHGADPWAKKEFAMMYLIPYVVLFFTGPGKFSLDARCCKKQSQAASTD